MLKRYASIALLVTLTSVALAACAANAPKTSAPPARKTALWKVTSAHRSLYITGDANVSLKEHPVPAPIAQAFAKSGELILEGNPDPDKAKVLPLVMKYGLQPSGQKLSDELSASQRKTVAQAFSKVGIPFASVQRVRPWVAVAQLGKGRLAELGIKPHQLYLHFYHKARSEKMSVAFLDTVSQEIELLAGMPRKLQVALLLQSAKEVLKPVQPDERARRVQEWRRGETSPLAKYTASKFKGYPRLYKITVTSRHPRWIETLEKKLSRNGKPVFVIVGAPHLFGRGNLLSGLRRHGYTVTQL